MISRIRTTFYFKAFTMLMLMVFLNSIAFPTISYALSGGPSQPEVHSFAPIGTTDMVDLTSGDFNYNLPLLEIGGYPINMVYNSGITMDQEASWVGLGWNINPGVINRSVRGIPDDFKGDMIKNEFSMKEMVNTGLNLGADWEAFGLENLINVNMSISFGISYSNYNGYNFVSSVGLSPDITVFSGERNSGSIGLSMNIGQNGKFTGNVGFSHKTHEKNKPKRVRNTSSIGLSFDNDGFNSFNASGSASVSSKLKNGKITKSRYLQNTSVGYSFGDKTYMPSINFARNNSAYTFNTKFGATVFGQDISATVTAYQSRNKLKYKNESAFGYGYMYMTRPENDILMDFNRENDASFHKKTTNLPLTNLTYDMYSVSGQGVAGSFRGVRGNVGSVGDKTVTSGGTAGSGGGEIGGGQLFSVGLDIAVSSITSRQKAWVDNNAALSKLTYDESSFNTTASSTLHEGFYFKQIGELSVDEEMSTDAGSMYSKVGKEKPVKISVGKKGNANSTYIDSEGNSINIDGEIKRENRAKRNQLLTYLTNAEASLLGKETNAAANKNHIAEMTIVKDDGSKYKYGTAAYNLKQEDYTFNVDNNEPLGYCGFVEYDLQDISAFNSKGQDEYYSKKITPAYAHSYLLTEILSPDYIDVDGNGPSNSDYGNWTKFDYAKRVNNYKWRTPFTEIEYQARHNRGLTSVNDDSKANIVYGEKELYYLNSITTKNQIAIFHTSERDDAVEAGGINGGKGEDKMYKLDSIALYNKVDFFINGITEATPIKKVFFKYSYSLCQGIYNSVNASGKLTLESVSFSYGKSKKSLLSPYNFTYGSGDENPNYNPNSYDMWGNYKEVGIGDNDCIEISEYPYTKQKFSPTITSDIAKSNRIRANAWNLKSIDLPSGATIDVSYESDDYSYVQNKKAQQFYKILGFSNSETWSSLANTDASNTLSTTYDESGPKNWLHIKVPSNLDTEQENKLLSDMGGYIYFRFKMQLAPAQFEYISGYFKVNTSNSRYYATNGYLALEVISFTKGDGVNPGQNVSPFAKAAWQFAKIHRPGLAKGQLDEYNEDLDIKEITKGALGIVYNLIDLFKGINSILKAKGVGQYVDVSSSWVRLNNSFGQKFGGGTRVSEISMNDNWSNMTSSSSTKDALYVQHYSYLNEDGTSSGVADWEPLMSKENPFVLPVAGTNVNEVTGMEFAFTEQPIGASFYPSPQIVYSKVTVTDKAYDASTTTEVLNNLSKTGKIENNFYTSKDYPTRVKTTTLDANPKLPNPIFSLFEFNVRDFMTTSQGFSIELNDMSGKAKSTKVYGEGSESPISAVYYNYEPDSQDLTPSYPKINDKTNSIFALYPDGTVKKSTIGVEMETVNDFREFKSKTHTGSLDGNLAGFLAFIFPAIVPSMFPTYSSYSSTYRSSVTTKLIFRRGVLNKVTKIEDNSSFSTQNLAYDSETGQVLLTGTKNEFGDNIYNFTYPAHWMYDGMGQAYKNNRLSGSLQMDVNGIIISTNDENLFIGDELMIIHDNSLKYLWVANQGDNKCLIDENGDLFIDPDPIQDPKLFTILNSGRSNQQAIPVGTVTCMKNPIRLESGEYVFDLHSDWGDDLENLKILDANATVYNDHWSTIAKSSYQGVPNPTSWSLYEELLDQYDDFGATSSNEGFITNTYKEFLNSLILTQSTGNLNTSNNSITQPSVAFQNGMLSYDYTNLSQTPIDALEFYNFSSEDDEGFPDALDLNCNKTSNLSLNGIDDFGDHNEVFVPNIWFGDNPGDECSCIGVHGHAFLEELNNGDYQNTEVTNVTLDSIYIDTFAVGTIDSLFYFSVTLQNEDSTFTRLLEATCWPYSKIEFDDFCPGNGTINPFIAGIKGNWKPERQYVYKTERNYNYTSESPILSTSGIYKEWYPFWYYSSDQWAEKIDYWQFTSTITKYSPFGNELENKDALGRYSSALFGYDYSLPKAVSQNAKYNESYNENFEDYRYPSEADCYYSPHFLFEYTTGIAIVDSIAHTGNSSLKIISSDSAIAYNDYIKREELRIVDTTAAYPLRNNDYIGGFSPSPLFGENDKEFVLSLWVKQNSSNDCNLYIEIYNDAETSIETINPTLISQNNTIIIEGWQRFEYTFNLSHYASVQKGKVALTIKNDALSAPIYIDDIRIHPFNSSLKSFVYHPITQKYVAELDENNYATFYEYDNAGRLLRIKKETERGIMTIQESYNHTQIGQ